MSNYMILVDQVYVLLFYVYRKFDSSDNIRFFDKHDNLVFVINFNKISFMVTLEDEYAMKLLKFEEVIETDYDVLLFSF